jgi:hypothetical protein
MLVFPVCGYDEMKMHRIMQEYLGYIKYCLYIYMYCAFVGLDNKKTS